MGVKHSVPYKVGHVGDYVVIANSKRSRKFTFQIHCGQLKQLFTNREDLCSQLCILYYDVALTSYFVPN